ncbi:tetratricopeptide repeat protein [Tsuneonella sp. HG222]
MSWVLAIGLTAAAFAVFVYGFRLPRAAWTTVLAALALGLAGYAWQGKPGLAGAPRAAAPQVPGEGGAMVEMRRSILPDRFESQSARLITADALLRRDRYTEAATLLRGAVRENPKDGESWLALGNALVAATGGTMTPAARLAYRRAEAVAPESPGVPFFVGISLLQEGQLVEAAQAWRDAAGRAPEGSDERAAIMSRVERLDTVMRQIVAQQQGEAFPPQMPEAPQIAPPEAPAP